MRGRQIGRLNEQTKRVTYIDVLPQNKILSHALSPRSACIYFPHITLHFRLCICLSVCVPGYVSTNLQFECNYILQFSKYL